MWCLIYNTPGNLLLILPLLVMLRVFFSNHFSQLSLFPDVDKANCVFVRCKHIWNVRAFSKPSFDCCKYLSVIFVGEEAVDVGGPKREFVHLALEQMANDGQLFQGPPDRHLFVHNVQALASRKFFYAGMLIAFSVANGGPGFPCLAASVFNYLCFGLEWNFTVQMDDLPDADIRAKLEKVYININL